MAINGLFDAAMTVPVVPFTFLAVAVVVYWLLVMVGGTVFEVADGDGAGLRAAMGLGGIPLNIVVSLLIVQAWIVSLAGMVALDDGAANTAPGAATSVGIASAAVAAAWLGSYLLARPIRRSLRAGAPPDPAEFVGSVCVVRTGEVGPDAGQAEVTGTDGSPVVIEVRQAGTDELRPGSTAMIHDYDAEYRVFWVTAFDPKLGTHL